MNRLLPFLLAVPLLAQGTFYGPTPGTGWCSITGATNATPIIVTFSGSCGLTNGASVLITLVEGNTNANINASPNQLVRKVASLSGNSFTLQDASGSNVAGNGAYTRGGIVRLAQSYATKADPIVWLDGPGGALTTAMSNSSAGGRANSANPPYAALVGNVNSWNSGGTNTQWGADLPYMSYSANAAIRYQADGNSASLTSAQFGMNNVEMLVGTPACNEYVAYCDSRISEVDYASENLPYIMQAYSIVRSSLTTGQKSRFLNMMLNDNLPASGGIDVTGCTKQAITPGTGTMTVTNGSSTIVGSGTSWNTPGPQKLSAGMTIYANGNGRPYIRVASVTDDTHFTATTTNFPVSTGSGLAFSIVPAWSSTNCGIVWFVKHHPESPLNGGSASTADYPSSGGAGADTYAWNNLLITKLMGFVAVGLATCEDDPRGCLLLEQAWEYWYDLTRPYILSAYTGFNTGGALYSEGRLGWMSPMIATMMRNSVNSPLDVTGDSYIDNTPSMFLRTVLPNSYGTKINWGDGYTGLTTSDASLTMILSLYMRDSADAHYLNYYLRNQWPYWSNLGYAGGFYLPWEYVFLSPTQTVTNPSGAAPNQYAWNQTGYSTCAAVFPNCVQNAAFNYGVSVTGWTPTDTMLMVSGATNNQDIDHQGEDVGPGIQVYRNSQLLGGDSGGLSGSGHEYNSGSIELGGASSYLQPGAYNNSTISLVTMPRVGGGSPTGDSQSRYAYWLVDCSQAYISTANVSRCQTGVAHFKKSGSQDYIVKYTDVALSGAISGASGAAIREYQHAVLNGIGTPASSAAISASRSAGTLSNTQASSKMNLAVLQTGGPIFINTQNSSDTNGGYTGQNGFTWRWGICPGSGSCNPSATAGEWITVVEPINGTGGSMPTLTQPTATNFRVVQIADSTTPKVAAFALGGSTYTSLGFTSTHSGTGQYLIAGLTPGTYTVLKNGSAFLSNQTVVAGDNTMYFESPSGAFSISQGGAPVVTLSCDMNGDGLTNDRDLQISISAYLGVIPCLAQYQLDQSGTCTATDVQRVAAAVLGSSCKTGS